MSNVSLIVISLIFNEVKKKKRDVCATYEYLLFVHHMIDRGSFISITNSNVICLSMKIFI